MKDDHEREMTLQEWAEKVQKPHLIRTQYDELFGYIDHLERSWKAMTGIKPTDGSPGYFRPLWLPSPVIEREDDE